MRNLTKTLVAVSLLTSTSVHSLGIGGIKLRSALNQKLNAEIALVTSGGESIDDIKVKLASPAKFDEAGVPWSYFLTKIKFTPIAKPDGSVVVKLTSDEALKEPYLDFLLEVSGVNGSMFREFTVLVDPPVTYKQPVIPVITPTQAVATPYTNSPMPMPVRRAEAALKENRETIEPIDSDVYNAVGEFGPVHRGETIRNIANQVKPDDVSTAQMIMAIYDANPRAFSRPNVNALMAGEMLTIPERDEVLKLSQRQALALYQQHRQSWRNGVRNARTNNTPQPAVASNPQSADQASAVAPIKQLKLNPPQEDTDVANGDALDGKGGNNKQNDENAAVSGVSAADIKDVSALDDADLKQRFDKIEQQLLMMQKMLELKDAQLATLQSQNKTFPVLAETAPKVVEVLPVDPLESMPEAEQKPASANAIKPSVANDAKPANVAVPVVKAVPAQLKPSVETASGNSFADYYWLAGAFGAGLLGALGLFWWRKRKVEQEIDTESMFASASQITLPDVVKESAKATDKSSGYEVAVVGDSAFVSEFTPSEFDAFETDQTEIDPLSEADVYLAYGRYQQAEELIRQVIAEHPDRKECKLKLLEIFHTSENHREFDQYVQQLTNEGLQADPGFWAKVVELSNEFTSGSGSFMGLAETGKLTSVSYDTTADFATPIDSEFKLESEFKPTTDEFDFDLGTLSANDAIAVPERIEKAEKNIVKPAAIVASESTTIFLDKEAESAKAKNISDLDFDIADDSASEVHELDFDLDAFDTESFSSSGENLEFMNDEDPNSLDFDLNDLDTKSTNAEADDFSGLEFNLSSFDENFNSVTTKNSDSKLDTDLSISGVDLDSSFASIETHTPDSFDFVLEDRADDKVAVDKDVVDFDFNNEEESSFHDFDFSDADIKVKPDSSVADKNLDLEDIDNYDFNFDFNLPAGEGSKKSEKPFDTVVVNDLTDADNVFETKVNLAHAYVDMGDVDAAKDIANDLLKGTAEQQKAGKEILEKIS